VSSSRSLASGVPFLLLCLCAAVTAGDAPAHAPSRAAPLSGTNLSNSAPPPWLYAFLHGTPESGGMPTAVPPMAALPPLPAAASVPPAWLMLQARRRVRDNTSLTPFVLPDPLPATSPAQCGGNVTEVYVLPLDGSASNFTNFTFGNYSTGALVPRFTPGASLAANAASLAQLLSGLPALAHFPPGAASVNVTLAVHVPLLFRGVSREALVAVLTNEVLVMRVLEELLRSEVLPPGTAPRAEPDTFTPGGWRVPVSVARAAGEFAAVGAAATWAAAVLGALTDPYMPGALAPPLQPLFCLGTVCVNSSTLTLTEPLTLEVSVVTPVIGCVPDNTTTTNTTTIGGGDAAARRRLIGGASAAGVVPIVDPPSAPPRWLPPSSYVVNAAPQQPVLQVPPPGWMVQQPPAPSAVPMPRAREPPPGWLLHKAVGSASA
jgi:hypothetical protein